MRGGDIRMAKKGGRKLGGSVKKGGKKGGVICS